MKTLKNKFIISLVLAFLLAICAAIVSFNPYSAKAEIPFEPTGNLCVRDGAAVRTVADKDSGLKFQIGVDKDWYAGLENAQAGAIILPSTYVAKATENSTPLTLNDLLAVVNEYGLPLKAVDTAGLADLDENYWTYALTLTNILDANYARDFTCIAYVRTSSSADEVIADYTDTYGLKPGNYFIAHNDGDDANRSVYTVAYNMLTSGNNIDDEQREIAKSYVDGVAVLSSDLSIANNTSNYTSPFTVNDTGSTILNAKSVIYNGQRTTSFPITSGDKTVHIAKTQGATANPDGGYTLDGVTVANGNAGSIAVVENNYLALNGAYGAGTYVEFEFTGNNMPQLVFFADEINGRMVYANEWTDKTVVNEGMIIMNGVKTDGVNGWTGYMKAWGNNRQDSILVMSSGQSNGKGFSQDELALTPDTEYRLVAGTYINTEGTRLYIDMYLINKFDNSIVGHIDISTSQEPSFFVGEGKSAPSGHIIAMAGLKGGDNSTFKLTGVGVLTDFDVSGEYKKDGMKFNGVTPNLDGSYTLAGHTIANGNPGSLKAVDSSYVALDAVYESGTYVEIEFTGNNMPNLLFFADEINSNMAFGPAETSDVTNDGMIVMNGLVATTSESGKTWTNAVKAYGNHRHDYGSTSPVIVNKSGTEDGGMSMDDLSATPDTEYRLVAGTYVKPTTSGTDTRLWLEMYLINKFDNSIVGHLNVSTGKNAEYFAADGTPKGYIVMYASFKGGDDTTFKFNGVGALTDFDVSGEFKKEGMKFKGVTPNSDGSYKLQSLESANNLSQVANGNTGTIRLYENSYVAFEGDYGVGTYVEFEFTGNNMPQLCFFADEINGWVSKGTKDVSSATNRGFMILNGVNTTGDNGWTNGLCGYANYRYSNNGDSSLVINKTLVAEPADEGDKVGNLSQDYLSANPDKTYRLVIGTMSVYHEATGEDRLWLSIRLFDKETNERLISADIDTGKAISHFCGEGQSVPSGHIIAMAGIKGGEDTTFKVTKGPGVQSDFDMVGGANT